MKFGIYANQELPIPNIIRKYVGKDCAYYNCGVTLLDLNFWRKDNILDQCKSTLVENFNAFEPMYEYYIQGILNLVFLNRFGRIENKYNYCPKYYKPRAIIYHWTGPKKLWNAMLNCHEIYKRYDVANISYK